MTTKLINPILAVEATADPKVQPVIKRIASALDYKSFAEAVVRDPEGVSEQVRLATSPMGPGKLDLLVEILDLIEAILAVA